MKNMKRQIGCLLAGTLLFALTACGQQPPQQSQASAESQTAQESTSSEDAQISSSLQAAENESSEESESGKTLVVYFSATGSTKAVAGYIAETMDADLYEIVPEEPYTSDDLNWRNPSSRSSIEHEDPDFRPAIAGEVADLSGYDTIFLGYPLWWGEAPHIVLTFMESVDLSGKTTIPFCTSMSSGFGSSGETLQAFAPNAIWLDGQRFPSSVADTDVVEWVSGLEITE